jgi:hypothetical protein
LYGSVRDGAATGQHREHPVYSTPFPTLKLLGVSETKSRLAPDLTRVTFRKGGVKPPCPILKLLGVSKIKYRAANQYRAR